MFGVGDVNLIGFALEVTILEIRAVEKVLVTLLPNNNKQQQLLLATHP